MIALRALAIIALGALAGVPLALAAALFGRREDADPMIDRTSA